MLDQESESLQPVRETIHRQELQRVATPGVGDQDFGERATLRVTLIGERRVAGRDRAVRGAQHHGLRAWLRHRWPVPLGEGGHPSHQPFRRDLHPAGAGLSVCHR